MTAFVFAPELSAGVRLGRARRHGVHVYGSWYADVDVRGRPFEHFVVPVGGGYELAARGGLRLLVDAAVGFELGNPATEGEAIPRIRLFLGWVPGG